MKELNFKIVDASLYMADMSASDKSGLWCITEPDSPYGANLSEMFDCTIRHISDDDKIFPIKQLGSFETLRKAKSFLNFLWQNGKTYDSLSEVEYVVAPEKYEFQLP